MLVPEDMRRVGSRPAPQFAADSDTIDSGAGEVGLALRGYCRDALVCFYSSSSFAATSETKLPGSTLSALATRKTVASDGAFVPNSSKEMYFR